MNESSHSNLSIVIPVYNGGGSFQECLSSLKQFVPQNIEIIVVADGDTDGSGDLAEAFGARVIRNPISQGPATARNKGAKAATGDILFFIDADVTIANDTIQKVENKFLEQPELAALMGSYDDRPGATNFLSQYKNLFHHYTHQMGNLEASTFWGACGAIRRDIFLKLGGFNESYRLPCVEDIELGYRLKEAGYQIQLCKEIQVKHLKRWGVISLLKADIFLRAIPWTLLLFRYKQFVNDLNINWTNRASVMLVYALLGVLVIALWWLPALLIALVTAIVLLIINVPVYQFFARKRGWLFALRTIPWHWLYYFYSGLAFGVGSVRYRLKALRA